MPNIFGADIAGKILQNLGPLVFDLTLTKVEAGTRGSSLTAGTEPSRTNYTVKGFVDSYTDRQIADSLVQQGDRKIIILGASLPDGVVPEPADEVTDEAGTTFVIVEDGVRRDPAGATYECQSR